MGNIIIGALFIIGGLSGDFVMRGTNSSGMLVLLGVGLIIKGIYDLSQREKVAALDIIPEAKAPLSSLEDPVRATGAKVYDANSETYVGKLKSVDMKKRTCVVKGDFGNEALKSINDLLVAEAGEATIETVPEESPPSSH